MTPSQYAARYLPIMVGGTVPIHITRYHLGAETAAKDKLLGALAGHLAIEQKKDRNYHLLLNIQGTPVSISRWQPWGVNLYNPFIGKGSPEECELVLQLATRVGGILPERLQEWADQNLGLDCNGLVGNYVYRSVLSMHWLEKPPANMPGPDSVITTIFQWAAGPNGRWALDDPSQIDPNVCHLIARVDSNGNVMPGGPNNVPGHIAMTEPGRVMRYVPPPAPTKGKANPTAPPADTQGQLALRSVESVGPKNTDPGIVENWMILQNQDPKNKKIFTVRREKSGFLDRVMIAPL